MAEIIPLPAACRACTVTAPVSPFADLRHWFAQSVTRLFPRRRRRRVGLADELPNHMRRDMGLAPHVPAPGRHYSDYLSSRGS